MTSDNKLITDQVRDRLVIVDPGKKTLEFCSLQNLYRVAELLEDRGREFFVIERGA